MGQQAMVEYRYRAVCEVLGGSPIGEVAVRCGTSRQSLHTWRRRLSRRMWRSLMRCQRCKPIRMFARDASVLTVGRQPRP